MLKVFNPRQTVLVTCSAEIESFGKSKEKDNIIPLDWHMPLSFSPVLYGISVGKDRFSIQLIRKSKVFVVNFMPYSSADKVLKCGNISGINIDKFDLVNFNKVHCDSIDCVRIVEAVAHIECEVIDEIDVGDHILFVGKVINTKEHSKEKRLFHLYEGKFSTTND